MAAAAEPSLPKNTQPTADNTATGPNNSSRPPTDTRTGPDTPDTDTPRLDTPAEQLEQAVLAEQRLAWPRLLHSKVGDTLSTCLAVARLHMAVFARQGLGLWINPPICSICLRWLALRRLRCLV